MRRELNLALSPYFLATREVPAMAALLLGTRTVTLLPVPREGVSRSDVRAAVERVPRYLRLMEAWEWSTPLWRSGAVAACFHDRICASELDHVYRRIEDEESLEQVRPLVRHIAAHRRASAPDPDNPGTDPSGPDADPYLNALVSDLLKGGPDPGINIPITAALDRFAIEHGLITIRSGVDSIAQRAESRLAKRIFSIGIPMLTRGSGSTIAALRRELAAPLEALKSAILGSLNAGSGRTVDAETATVLAAAAKKFAAEFDAWAESHIPGDDDHGERLTAGYVNITGVELPEDAVLLAGRAAARSYVRSASPAARRAPIESQGNPPSQNSPSRALIALVIREMNVHPVSESAGRAATADRH